MLSEKQIRKDGYTRLPLKSAALAFVEGYDDLIAWLDHEGLVRYCLPGGSDGDDNPLWAIVPLSRVSQEARQAARQSLYDYMQDDSRRKFPKILGDADYDPA